MKKFTLALIILGMASCDDGAESNPDGFTSAPQPLMMMQHPPDVPIMLIPDSMWEWKNWIR